MAFDLDEWNNIGNILVRRGSLSKRELKTLLVEQNRRSSEKIGALAVELGFIDEGVLEVALHEQAIHRVPERSETCVEAKSILQNAFASVSKEVDRLSERRAQKSSVVVLEMSPSK